MKELWKFYGRLKPFNSDIKYYTWQEVVEMFTEKEGKKFDDSKPRWNLMPMEVLEPVLRVLMTGARKYGDDNWKFVKPFEERYYNALMRHVLAWKNGNTVDTETGESHLAHAICNLIFLLWGEMNTKQSIADDIEQRR